MICGAATAWQVVRALEIHRLLNDPKNVDTKRKALETEKSKKLVYSYLDLVALATICDVIPLTEENRKLVQIGFQIMRERERPALEALRAISGAKNEEPSSALCGFTLGPPINAASRIDSADLARELLATRTDTEARVLAKKLESLNKQRKTMTDEYLKRAEDLIQQRWGDEVHSAPALVVLGVNWPVGVVGVIAGRLAEKYHKPVFVASMDSSGKIKGSARSPIPAINLHNALQTLKPNLVRGGGHSAAAGFSSDGHKFAGFETNLLAHIAKITTPDDYHRHILIDVELTSLRNITKEDVAEFNRLEPFGSDTSEFPQPHYLLRNCRVIWVKPTGTFGGNTTFGFEIDGRPYVAMGFTLGDRFPDLKSNMTVDIVCTMNIYKGNLSISARQIKYNKTQKTAVR
jgi:single-stranded-DNA-specific exonuclease